jgi:hypothetical protein
MKPWRARVRDFAFTAGRLAVEIAPVVTVLGRGSSPIAWAAAGCFACYKVYIEVTNSRPRLWDALAWDIHHAILSLARAARLGSVVARYNGGEERNLDGVVYGSGDGWVVGPYGDPTPIVDGLWAEYGGLMVHKDQANEAKITISRDRRSHEPPSALAESIAADCLALRRVSAGVGLLIDGPPGTGKSQALLYVAHRLGGRTIRASFKAVSPQDVLVLATTLAADVVVLDDIDRGETAGALDAVEQLIARGVAVLASSNAKAEICTALLRDGRIDDHRTFGAVEPDVLERLAVGLEADVVERLRACTVASVARYVERRAAWGAERALARLKPLVEPAAVDGPGPAA